MTTTLTDPKRLAKLSKDGESGDLDAALEAFIQSLSLPPDEEGAVMDSLNMLPDQVIAQSALPKNPPNLMFHQWWT